MTSYHGILKWPSHDNLLANLSRQNDVCVCERQNNSWLTVDDKSPNLSLFCLPTRLRTVVVLFTHGNLSLPTFVCRVQAAL